ncbi:MAG: rhomboid family intramembrane serine protease [Bradyrhizobiaceae bacterium]|nr:rhomboid family intramembrane serine protease [Bradyrhizobiaceae bacterium]
MFIPLYDDNPNDPLFYPWVTRALVAINVLIFVVLQSILYVDDPNAPVTTFGVTPASVTLQIPVSAIAVPSGLTFITYMFLHGGWMHLIGNMLFLWVFGDNVEHAMGHVRFAVFYLACGVAGAVAHYLSVPDSTQPLIGASAAIAGIVAAYLMLFPHAKVWILLLARIPVKLSAKWVLGAWVLFQFVNVIVSTDPQTAWWAHVGGILAGAVLVVFLRRPDIPLFARDVRTITDVR